MPDSGQQGAAQGTRQAVSTDVQVLILQQGDARYEEVLGALRADTALLAYMWQAAESRLDEHLDKVWVVAVGPAGRALAWAAYEPATEGRHDVAVRCVNSFERPESWDADWYAVVYQVRHELIRHLPAVTYVFDEPLPLHLWDGWRPVAEGWSAEPDAPSHHWTELVWLPTATAGI